MNKKFKILLYIILFLIPVAIFSFCKKETIFNNKLNFKISVNLLTNGESVKLELEDYVLGVLAAEMPASFLDEALKAQSIAARTFAVNKMNNKNIIEIDTNDQAYINKNQMQEKWGNDFDKYYLKLSAIVDFTKNKVITYNDEIIKSYYFSMSNGKTENSIQVFNESKPYLQSVDSKLEENLNNMTKTIQISKKNFCLLLTIKNCNNINIGAIKSDSSERIETIIINDNLYTGLEVRKKLDLRSTDFQIEIKKDNVNITTKGYGHGVGMSQYGANELAKSGYSYEDIIKHYYQGVKIADINSIK